MQVDGIVAIVTGGASGLGRASAGTLRGGGRRRGGESAQRSRWRGVVRVHFAAADVRDPEAVAAAADLAMSRCELRVAVNCAGIGPPGRVLRKGEPLALEAFASVIEVKPTGTSNVIRLAAAAIAKARNQMRGGEVIRLDAALRMGPS